MEESLSALAHRDILGHSRGLDYIRGFLALRMAKAARAVAIFEVGGEDEVRRRVARALRSSAVREIVGTLGYERTGRRHRYQDRSFAYVCTPKPNQIRTAKLSGRAQEQRPVFHSTRSMQFHGEPGVFTNRRCASPSGPRSWDRGVDSVGMRPIPRSFHSSPLGASSI